MSLKFLVFLGSSREGRMGENVAKCVVKKLKALSHQAEMIVGKCQTYRLENIDELAPWQGSECKQMLPTKMSSSIDDAEAVVVLLLTNRKSQQKRKCLWIRTSLAK
ncbi:hypothetical protein E2C01_075268 [Portunus trituberculatus]|uniref:Uncharacterized protein n=1 Tax=Portunus trituberculatus TaxID=210409 RepID=A0A5B7IAB1_PORTR|nr:hypothetical protein [Portunus trituberculatus]